MHLVTESPAPELIIPVIKSLSTRQYHRSAEGPSGLGELRNKFISAGGQSGRHVIGNVARMHQQRPGQPADLLPKWRHHVLAVPPRRDLVAGELTRHGLPEPAGVPAVPSPAAQPCLQV